MLGRVSYRPPGGDAGGYLLYLCVGGLKSYLYQTQLKLKVDFRLCWGYVEVLTILTLKRVNTFLIGISNFYIGAVRRCCYKRARHGLIIFIDMLTILQILFETNSGISRLHQMWDLQSFQHLTMTSTNCNFISASVFVEFSMLWSIFFGDFYPKNISAT